MTRYHMALRENMKVQDINYPSGLNLEKFKTRNMYKQNNLI
jgi:hypothetical protein